jgi:hypothetical protein
MKKTVLALAVVAAAGFAGAANAASQATTAVFNMYAQKGLDQNAGNQSMSGPINVDTTVTGFINTTAGTWGVQSTTAFFGLIWTASNGTLITATGNYALNTATAAVTSAAPDTVGTADGSMHFTVGAGQVAGIIDFAWGTTTGIRVVNVWNVSACGSNTCYITAAVPGMENGPFPGYNAQFNLTAAPAPAPVPVPAAVWLFGSGLLGLVGVARRKKAA